MLETYSTLAGAGASRQRPACGPARECDIEPASIIGPVRPSPRLRWPFRHPPGNPFDVSAAARSCRPRRDRADSSSGSGARARARTSSTGRPGRPRAGDRGAVAAGGLGDKPERPLRSAARHAGVRAVFSLAAAPEHAGDANSARWFRRIGVRRFSVAQLVFQDASAGRIRTLPYRALRHPLAVVARTACHRLRAVAAAIREDRYIGLRRVPGPDPVAGHRRSAHAAGRALSRFHAGVSAAYRQAAEAASVLSYVGLRANAETVVFACVSAYAQTKLLQIFPELGPRSFVVHDSIAPDYFPPSPARGAVADIVTSRIDASSEPQLGAS